MLPFPAHTTDPLGPSLLRPGAGRGGGARGLPPPGWFSWEEFEFPPGRGEAESRQGSGRQGLFHLHCARWARKAGLSRASPSWILLGHLWADPGEKLRPGEAGPIEPSPFSSPFRSVKEGIKRGDRRRVRPLLTPEHTSQRLLFLKHLLCTRPWAGYIVPFNTATRPFPRSANWARELPCPAHGQSQAAAEPGVPFLTSHTRGGPGPPRPWSSHKAEPGVGARPTHGQVSFWAVGSA